MLEKTKLSLIIKVLIAVSAVGTFSVSAQEKQTVISIAKKRAKQEKNKKAPAPKPAASQAKTLPGLVHAHSLGVGVGQTFLYGDFADLGEDKITGEIYYTYSASHSFDFVANLHYSEHKHKNFKVEIPSFNIGIKAKFFQFDAFSPYGIAGLGFYKPKVKRVVNNEIKDSETKTTFGTHYGVGADLRLNRHATIGVLFHYHNPFDVKQDVGSDVEGSYGKLLIIAAYTF